MAGIDVKQATIDAVNRGEVPFVEPDMGVVVSGAVSLGNLVAMTTVPAADAFIIAVPTRWPRATAPTSPTSAAPSRPSRPSSAAANW